MQKEHFLNQKSQQTLKYHSYLLIDINVKDNKLNMKIIIKRVTSLRILFCSSSESSGAKLRLLKSSTTASFKRSSWSTNTHSTQINFSLFTTVNETADFVKILQIISGRVRRCHICRAFFKRLKPQCRPLSLPPLVQAFHFGIITGIHNFLIISRFQRFLLKDFKGQN